MKKFIIRLLIFLLLLPLLYLATYLADTGLKKSRYLNYAEWNDLFDGKINADVLIMGTSRAWKHVSPQILDTALHVNSYNLGMDGAAFDLQYDRFRLYLMHNKKPEYILQEVGFPTFTSSEEAQYFEQYIPWLSDPVIWNIAKRHCPSIGVAERYFPLYKYNNQLPLLGEGIRSYFGKGVAAMKYKGYQGVAASWDSSFYLFKQHNPAGITIQIDPGAVKQFDEYLHYCDQNNIKVILFYAPTYYQFVPYLLNYTAIKEMIANLALKNHVPFLDYSTDSISYNKGLFYNSQHLNKKGSEVFSNQLAKDVAKYISNRPT